MALTVHGHPQTFPRYSPYSYACDVCGRFEIECAWPRGPDVCLDCTCHCRALQACLKHVPLLRTRLRTEPNLEMMAWVDACCFDYKPYTRKAKQLYFLESVLRAHGSPFLQFTYCHNLMLGSISQREDVLDRITSFLAPSNENARRTQLGEGGFGQCILLQLQTLHS